VVNQRAGRRDLFIFRRSCLHKRQDHPRAATDPLLDIDVRLPPAPLNQQFRQFLLPAARASMIIGACRNNDSSPAKPDTSTTRMKTRRPKFSTATAAA
jgi:hypothetical protein